MQDPENAHSLQRIIRLRLCMFLNLILGQGLMYDAPLAKHPSHHDAETNPLSHGTWSLTADPLRDPTVIPPTASRRSKRDDTDKSPSDAQNQLGLTDKRSGTGCEEM
ncbi:uncharacterized protein N7506_004096 [Penicillium brevicompactum]|uniref:uncharacterized protein n=1 Tax=Penicillium brevicompactum TaxID=5074 RepID=UPI0025417B66|nr:uncharacterized protein N7506_004096 [Penicillium brevicompactum]KAJ5336074.1 hypothetical protein N7506_004096 [Penicillium brevicompactum]